MTETLMDARFENGALSSIRTDLMVWYRRRGRDLPWRRTRDPYCIWVSEIMLQQTQVSTVIPYYERFLARFPDCAILAAAPLQEVLKLWENLGYYSRARALHRAAREVVSRHGGLLPSNHDDLIQLPGIGPYTAGALLSMAFGEPVPAVDGNVRRVLCRVMCITEPLGGPVAQAKIHALAAQLVPQVEPGSFNQAVMDLGAGVCVPRRPACMGCPIERHCLARRHGRETELPVFPARTTVPRREAAVGLIRNSDGALLMVLRRDKGLLGGLWGFPGGERLEGETFEGALRRGIQETLGFGVRLAGYPGRIEHAYTHFRVTVQVFPGVLEKEDGGPVKDATWRWVSPAELGTLPVSKLETKIAAAMLR